MAKTRGAISKRRELDAAALRPVLNRTHRIPKSRRLVARTNEELIAMLGGKLYRYIDWPKVEQAADDDRKRGIDDWERMFRTAQSSLAFD